MDSTKTCTKCGVEKPRTEFYPNRSRNSIMSACKECSRQSARQWNRDHPEINRERARRWWQAHPDRDPEKLRAQQRRGAKRHYERMDVRQQRDQRLRRNFGITMADYDRMLADQGGVCAICGEAPPPGKVLAVDHCHASGKIRGLLCQGCNFGIGFLADDPRRVEKAARYLRDHQRR